MNIRITLLDHSHNPLPPGTPVELLADGRLVSAALVDTAGRAAFRGDFGTGAALAVRASRSAPLAAFRGGMPHGRA